MTDDNLERLLVRSGWALLGAHVAALLASVPRQSAPTHATKVWSHVKRAYPRSQLYCANDLFAGAGARKHPSPTIFKPRLSRCATSESDNTSRGRCLRLGTLGCLCCYLGRVGATPKRANPRYQGVEPRQARLPTIAVEITVDGAASCATGTLDSTA